MTGRCAHTDTQTHIERTHYLRHSLRSLGGDNNDAVLALFCDEDDDDDDDGCTLWFFGVQIKPLNINTDNITRT